MNFAGKLLFLKPVLAVKCRDGPPQAVLIVVELELDRFDLFSRSMVDAKQLSEQC